MQVFINLFIFLFILLIFLFFLPLSYSFLFFRFSKLKLQLLLETKNLLQSYHSDHFYPSDYLKQDLIDLIFLKNDPLTTEFLYTSLGQFNQTTFQEIWKYIVQNISHDCRIHIQYDQQEDKEIIYWKYVNIFKWIDGTNEIQEDLNHDSNHFNFNFEHYPHFDFNHVNPVENFNNFNNNNNNNDHNNDHNTKKNK